MRVEIGIHQQVMANKFLRALWAEFRAVFPRYAWQYLPIKQGRSRRIMLGQLDLGIPDGPITVSITYIRRGGIQDLIIGRLWGPSIEEDPQVIQSLQQAVENAREKYLSLLPITFHVFFKSSSRAVSRYQADFFEIEPVGPQISILSLTVRGYDEIDANSIFKIQTNRILDVLAVETNTGFWKEDRPQELIDYGIEKVVFTDDNDWIDDYQCANGFLIISQKAYHLLDRITSVETLAENDQLYLDACNLFHTAQKSRVLASMFTNNHTLELGVVMYMSALEVASVINSPKSRVCETCGQQIYSIRKRVMSKANKYLLPEVAKACIGSLYDKRSKYLHTGAVLVDRSYTGKSNPQLDADSPNGCVVPLDIPGIMIHEFVSYLLRKILLEIEA